MLYFLFVSRRHTMAFIVSTAAAVAASMCFLQGLILWPVGLVCLAWNLPRDPRSWTRRKAAEMLIWLTVGVGTSVIALWEYKFQTLGCSANGSLRFNCAGNVSSFTLHHPLQTFQFMLIELGEVIPNADTHTLWLNGLPGAVLLMLAGAVVVCSIQHRHADGNCLPVALILFGLLFDLIIAVGRVQFLTTLAPQSSYTLPNLLILLGIVIYGWDHLRIQPSVTRSAGSRILVVTAIVFLVTQIALTTNSGITDAEVI